MVSKMYGPQMPKQGQVGQIGRQQQQISIQPGRTTGGKSEFQRILDQKTGRVEFSGHAMKRLAQRNIELSSQEMDRLTAAVDQAADKGSRESLVLLNGMAFVVSVPNRTVITAMDMDSMKENVVTNIDSAVIA